MSESMGRNGSLPMIAGIVALAGAGGVNALTKDGGATLAAFAVTFLAVFFGSVAWQLRTRERYRLALLVATPDVLRFEGGGQPFELPLERLAAFQVKDAGNATVRFTLRLTDGQVAHIEAAATEAGPLATALDARLPSALSGTGLRPALARQGRSLAEWRAALQGLCSTRGAGAYRDGSLPVDPLVSAVGDERLGAEERIGAALALGSRGGERREKVRIADGAVKTAALRLAIDRALVGTMEDVDVARALEEEARLRG